MTQPHDVVVPVQDAGNERDGESPQGSGPRRPRTWRRAFRYLAIPLGAAVVAILVLFVVSRLLASFTDYNWFHAGCGILALAGFLGMIGAAVWNGVIVRRRRRGRSGTARPLLIVSLAVFGLVPFVVGIVTYPSPAQRPADAAVWAGLGTMRDGITRVTATWEQPRVYPLGSRFDGVSFWVGLADTDGNVEQIGTDGYCQRHTPAIYDAWYELYPASKVTTRLAVRPGERVTATVVSLGNDRFQLTLADATTGARFSTVQVARGVGSTHGAIIVEEPSFSDMDLAGFGTVRFTQCAFDGRPIGSFRLSPFDIASDDGTLETITSGLASDGTTFTVTRR